MGWIALNAKGRQPVCYREIVNQIPVVHVSAGDRPEFFPLMVAPLRAQALGQAFRPGAGCDLTEIALGPLRDELSNFQA